MQSCVPSCCGKAGERPHAQVRPAVSPWGHVMGAATWAAVLAEQGKCPFTQNPLRRDQVLPQAPPFSRP